jgi:hypothetical protein
VDAPPPLVTGAGRGDEPIQQTEWRPESLKIAQTIWLWAARHGIVALTMSDRLAPEHVWPAGADDVKSVVAWLRAHATSSGADPARVVLMAHSPNASQPSRYHP